MPTSNYELENIDTFMEWVVERHPNEPEYHQAVHGVAVHLLDEVRENKLYRDQRILQRLTEPDRMISFRVVYANDDGVPQIHHGYRVQHSNALGPYKGGLRFDPSVCPAILKFLAFEQLFKNSLTGLNLGAGKGGADFNPKGKSDGDVMRFCQAFMTELARHIGQMRDVPAGDIGVGAREIGYLFGQYKRLENQFTGVLTGKSIGAGGSEMRTEATGYGAIYFLEAMLAENNGEIDGQRIAISGAGNVALHAAEKAALLGGVVISLSNREGLLVKDDGLSCENVQEIRKRYDGGENFGDIASAIGGKFKEGSRPWELDCDIAIPAATQNELGEADARSLVDAGVKAIVEAANMPLTDEAEEIFDEAGVAIAPGKAANAGGVAISGLEMSQNRLGRSWSKGRMDKELREIMSQIFERTRQYGEFEGSIHYRRGADLAGFDRVAKAVSSFGIM